MYNHQLETFIRVADAGSFNKAAEESYITPTAIIKQIHDNFDVFDFALADAEMQEITTLNKDKRYYEVTEDKLAAFATMFPPVDDQK